MKMNKKGFTLIELLAIIVILAIIAVITVPIILNIIDNAKKGAAKDSVIGYGKAVELAYTQYQFDQKLGTTVAGNTDVYIYKTESENLLKVDYDGTAVTCTQIVIKEGKLQMAGCTITGTTGTFSYNAGKAYADTDTTGYVKNLTDVINTLPTAPAAQETSEP